VLYSPDAEEQLARLGVNREFVETVVAHPNCTARQSKAWAVQLERDFGGHKLRLLVAEPWPACGAVYVKKVQWSQLAGSRWRWNIRGIALLQCAAAGVRTSPRASGPLPPPSDL
jgi:hypothetical protein